MIDETVEPPGEGAGAEELVVRDGKDGPQLVAARKLWNAEAEEKFLNALGASCNVTLAAKAAGFVKEGIYRHRRLDPVFAANWDAAIAQGCARIEAMLIDNAERSLEGSLPDPECPIPPMTVREALTLLAVVKPKIEGNSRKKGWSPPPRNMDAVRSGILTKLAAIARMPDA